MSDHLQRRWRPAAGRTGWARCLRGPELLLSLILPELYVGFWTSLLPMHLYWKVTLRLAGDVLERNG